MMKRHDLARSLKSLGWELEREGGNHSIWSKKGVRLSVPRHKEINELTAKGILRSAKEVQ